MKIDFVERPDVRVAYFRYTGPFGDPVGRFWRTTVASRLADHGLLDCPRFGVTRDDPMSTPPDRCRYDACVALPPGLSLPDASEATLPGGRYAVTHFKGSVARIGIAWGDFVNVFHAISDRKVDATRSPFEHYPRGSLYDSRTGTFACELCLPIVDPR
jgi:AraC family transcriptional regulator